MDADGSNPMKLDAAEESSIELFAGEGGTPSQRAYPSPGDWDFQAFGIANYVPTPSVAEGAVVLANLAPTVNSASPLSIVSVFGSEFTSSTFYNPILDADGKIATRLGGTCVEIGGERAPLFAITPTQANIQIPGAATFGPVSVVIVRNCNNIDEVRSPAASVMVEEATPAFFLYPPYKTDGLIAARFNDGYAAVAPAGMFSEHKVLSRPAKPGDIIVLFGTGWGRTEADLATGELGVGADRLLPSANPMVTFGGIPLAAENVSTSGLRLKLQASISWRSACRPPPCQATTKWC